MNSVYLKIADFIIELRSQHEINLEIGYKPFEVSIDGGAQPDMLLDCHLLDEIAEQPAKKLVFDSSDEICRYYKIYKNADTLYFEIFDQLQNDRIQQIGILSADYRHWDVYCRLNDDGSITPLLYPLGPIVLQYLTVKKDAVMIHASCVTDGKIGRLFSGFSGVGKSTMAGIWQNAGYTVINDDRLVIRLQDGEIFVHNTPMYYADKPKKTVLKQIFLIRHFPENEIQHIGGATAVSKVMAFCIQNNFNPEFITHSIDILSRICENASVYTLGFVPDKNVVDYILKKEN